ncbi:hypothetical protein QWZ04_23415 [Vibrio tapetis subsp. quintayensis]|uniref:hypothetical protein n=1 Tax=Vibrio tapetis TaxID=52443 RepID=UPI0025B5C067|nr:hypothetical protein [Vibrio tapetis]MDN3683254.1 hypothetical protein [Vibrio tapetis subsp. quintayensis]
MSVDTVFRQQFVLAANEFVEKATQHPDIQTLSFGLMMFLIVVVYFQEVVRFMTSGIDLEKIVTATLMVFVSLALYKGYNTAIDVLIETFDNVGLLLLKIGTGNSDPMFLFKWVNRAFIGMYNEEVSFWSMSTGDAFNYLVWQVVTMIIVVAMYFTGSWATWCLLLGKILAIFFVPCLVHPGTRTAFDGWFRYLIGSLMLLIVLRACAVLVALAIKAQFTASGILQCAGSTTISQCMSFGQRNNILSTADYIELVVTMIISFLMIKSSVELSKALIGNVASPSASAAKGINNLAKSALSSQAGSKIAKVIMAKFGG